MYSTPSADKSDKLYKPTTPVRTWSWFTEDDFVVRGKTIVGETYKSLICRNTFKSSNHLNQNEKNPIFADKEVAIKYPREQKKVANNFYKEFHQLSHQISCLVIQHPYIGFFILIIAIHYNIIFIYYNIISIPIKLYF